MDKGAYMYYKNNKHYLVIYAKLPQTTIANAIPLTYKINGGDYIMAIFIGKMDYLSQSSYEKIYEFIKQDEVIDIINNDYNKVKKVLTKLTVKEYIENLEFSKKQLESISNEKLKVIENKQSKFIYKDNFYFYFYSFTNFCSDNNFCGYNNFCNYINSYSDSELDFIVITIISIMLLISGIIKIIDNIYKFS